MFEANSSPYYLRRGFSERINSIREMSCCFAVRKKSTRFEENKKRFRNLFEYQKVESYQSRTCSCLQWSTKEETSLDLIGSRGLGIFFYDV